MAKIYVAMPDGAGLSVCAAAVLGFPDRRTAK